MSTQEKNEQLKAALHDMFSLIEEQHLVRNTKHDNEPGWAMKQLQFVSRLAKAQKALIDEVEPGDENQPLAEYGAPT